MTRLPKTDPTLKTPSMATFAGGCFWCMEAVFDPLEGVQKTVSGYTGGVIENPTYQMVCEGKSGHVEALRIIFDPEKISYPELLTIFWRNIDPGRDDGQFCDIGPQYRPVIFVHNPEQRQQAEDSHCRIQKMKILGNRPVRVDITQAGPFYPAEEEHQNYYRKNPLRYQLYHQGCGREGLLQTIWGPSKDCG